MACVIPESKIDCRANDRLCVLAGKYLRMLCDIQPDKVALQSKTELKVIEKLPYPLAPSNSLNKGIEPAVTIPGNIILNK